MSKSSRWAGRAALGLVGVLALGCTADHLERSDKVTPQAGDAVAFNRAVQTQDPWPPYVGNQHIAHHGAVIGNAMDRYKTDQTIQPRGLETTDVGAGVRPPPPPPPPPTRQ